VSQVLLELYRARPFFCFNGHRD